MSSRNFKLFLSTITVATASSFTVRSSSVSSWMEVWCAAAAALAGAVAVVGFLKHQNENYTKDSPSQSNNNGCADDTSDAISVDGSVMVTLPTWTIAASEDYFNQKYISDEEMMFLAIHLSDRNITEGTGGPFGAAIFERHPEGHCTLVSVGVNRVVPLGNSTLHGETVAIQLAQRRVGSHTLQLDVDGSDGNEDGLFWDEKESDSDPMRCTSSEERVNDSPATKKRTRQFELFSSCEPCAMCLGATLWSGVSRLVCGATKHDAQAIGFDEGPVSNESYEHLEKKGIEVKKGVLQQDAARVLQRYGASGTIYNR